MNVKFIVTKDGRIVFGDKDYRQDGHFCIAVMNGIAEENVANGGIADLENKRIWGESTEYGKYNVEQMRELLPDWQVDRPGPY